MEYWWLNKKEMRLIADLMVQELVKKPDGSNLGMMTLLQEALKAEYVEGTSKEGYPVHGLKFSDIVVPDGKHLSELIKWDFENAVWYDGYSQGCALYDIFEKKVIRQGFIIDSSHWVGLYVGVPYMISRCFRNKHKLITSFAKVMEVQNGIGDLEKYFVRKRVENGWYNKPAELQFWRIPVGCNTGRVSVFGRVSCYVMNGKCHYESSRWDYAAYYPRKKAAWHEQKTKIDLKINQSGFIKKNRASEEVKEPATAWFKLTNTGKSDLLVFVVDAENKL